MIKVLFFGEVKRILNKDFIEFDFTGSLSALKNELANTFPEVASVLNTCAFAVNKEYKTLNYELKGNEEVAIIPPVGGG
ncbi:MoaD/ThiS family protein [Caldisericum exile]|uniref:Molybdopterin synthase sulfur carrier subunit n=1 Tax=Caldisericum exile (strain DSM 21853 / NBRC 104410 / AZM16c01) TaxID=511051 RepID=A0A7U6GDQ7_CALEA|nr:MoaD/ThiS family protein [Caldisericum exile]BAL80476.1 hypothetical protein CSE_03500 [Caldisericum exile AZM16c01]